MGGCVTSVPKEVRTKRSGLNNAERPTPIDDREPLSEHSAYDSFTEDEDDDNDDIDGDVNIEHRQTMADAQRHAHSHTHRQRVQHRPVLFDTKSLPDRQYLIQILRATNVAAHDQKQPPPSSSDVETYVVLKVLNSDSSQCKGKELRSLHRVVVANNANPIWNCYRTFMALEFHDKLRFELWRFDATHGDSLIGSAQTAISQLFVNVFGDHSMYNDDAYDDDNNFLIDDAFNQTQPTLHSKAVVRNDQELAGIAAFDGVDDHNLNNDNDNEVDQEHKEISLDADDDAFNQTQPTLHSKAVVRNDQELAGIAAFGGVDDHNLNNENENEMDQEHKEISLDGDDDDEDCIQQVRITLNSDTAPHPANDCRLYFKIFAMGHNALRSVDKKTIFFIQCADSEYTPERQQTDTYMDHALQFNQVWKAQRQQIQSESVLSSLDQARAQQPRLQHCLSVTNTMEDDLNDFVSAEIIYTSPSCRATQTAMLALLDHPCLSNTGLTYARNLHVHALEVEEKEHFGAQQFERAVNGIMREKQELTDKLKQIQIDYNDSGDGQLWWQCGRKNAENEQATLNERLHDFLYYLRYSNEHIVVCVTHSMWLKHFLKCYVNLEEIDKFTPGRMVQSIKSLAKETEEEEEEEEELQRETLEDNMTASSSSGASSSSSNDTATDEAANYERKRKYKQHDESSEEVQLRSVGSCESQSASQRAGNAKKAQNIACVRVDIAFSDRFEHGVDIDDVRLLFGTQFG
eukprot:CAMPEP_0197078188 /NCGR_PEP_ID=MMETSP1384-20130603/212994_1 /TAXON_ID=29189 /ORGANISM="Ammonia sp." /LENGTH=744 /DNA_ID=CAMNT_0042517053 /DNA_START=24 /DNA_END=2258 /DNA_ORIENTATION=+